MIDSWYDPQVEFQEVAVTLNGERTWKVHGPDLNGVYGSLMGVGGLEATIRERDGYSVGVISDGLGNCVGTVVNGQFRPATTVLSSYGPLQGFDAPKLSVNVPLAEATLWRSKRIDPTGFYYFGARYLDPVAGKWLSPDPLGHSVSLSLYDYCANDPVNCVDPDGRQAWQITPVQAWYDPSVRNMINSPEYQRGFQIGMAQGAWLGTKLTIAVGVGIYTGGAAAPLLANLGASTPYVVIGSGMVGGFSGDIAVQTVEHVTGERQEYSGTQMGVSTLLGGGIGYGVNRVLSPRLMSGQMGNAEIGALAEQRVAQQLGENIRGQQVRFRTPDPSASPRGDFVIDDASSASGLKVIEVKPVGNDLSYAQTWGYPYIQGGRATPYGSAARQAGLALDEALAPTPVEVWRYHPYELLPFSPGLGGGIGAAAGTSLGGVTYLHVDSTGKYIKHR